MNRRAMISFGAAALGFPAIVRGASAANTTPLDEAMLGFMDDHAIPGAALGIARGGRIVYAKGFGLANRERGVAVAADAKFRLASVSKPITSAAVLRLVEQGKLALDEPMLPKLRAQPLGGDYGDERLAKITVRQLLQHTGGWRSSRSGDPLFKSLQICRDAGVAGPADAQLTVRWGLAQRLDFDPGSDYAYSNFGYCVLGRLIEAVTGQSYESAVRKLVLNPCGATGIVQGRSLEPVRGEVSYYHFDDSMTASVFPHLGSRSAWPYGAFSLEANDANGGWVANVSDMLRFLTALDENAKRPLLKASSLQEIYNSAAPGSQQGAVHYGLGWLVRPDGQNGRPNLWHVGGLPGTKTIAARLGDGFDWVALFNKGSPSPDAFNNAIQSAVYQAAAKVTNWGK